MHLPRFLEAATAQKPPGPAPPAPRPLREGQGLSLRPCCHGDYRIFFFSFLLPTLLPTHTPPERKAPGSASFQPRTLGWASALPNQYSARSVFPARRDSRQPIQQLRTQRSAPPNRPHLLPQGSRLEPHTGSALERPEEQPQVGPVNASLSTLAGGGPELHVCGGEGAPCA